MWKLCSFQLRCKGDLSTGAPNCCTALTPSPSSFAQAFLEQLPVCDPGPSGFPSMLAPPGLGTFWPYPAPPNLPLSWMSISFKSSPRPPSSCLAIHWSWFQSPSPDQPSVTAFHHIFQFLIAHEPVFMKCFVTF